MKIRLTNIKMTLEHSKEDIFRKTQQILSLSKEKIKSFEIVRQSVDAREKNRICFVYTVEVETTEKNMLLPRNTVIVQDEAPVLNRGENKLKYPPVIVGMGPAGLFAAWKLARWGYKPIVIERGKDVLARQKDVNLFWETGQLNPESNVQFGEGGAGTFSDGKLTARTKDYKINEVFKIFIECGAPQEIAYQHKPHIGTDILRKVVVTMREQIKAAGGQIFFNSRLTNVDFQQDTLQGIEINDSLHLQTNLCILAVGHSSRDTYAMLNNRGIPMQAKPFAVGVRIEHEQAYINHIQHGEFAGHSALGSADYVLTHRDQETGRGVFSFCMCPGGQVVAAASEKGGVVTNGMSFNARKSGTANSAIVVSVSPSDFPNDGDLAGIEFQRRLEKSAYQLGGGDYVAPACDVSAYLNDETELTPSKFYPTYQPGVKKANLREIFSVEINDALLAGLKSFNRKIPGFCKDAVMTGVESRTSAPVRILRNEKMQSPLAAGIYPIGEGAGYAGGIVSSAIDGLKVAEEIFTSFSKPWDGFSSRDLLKMEEWK